MRDEHRRPTRADEQRIARGFAGEDAVELDRNERRREGNMLPDGVRIYGMNRAQTGRVKSRARKTRAGAFLSRLHRNSN